MKLTTPWLLAFGISISAIYLIFLVATLGPQESFLSFITSAPYNARGDFLAGVFGPLAFLWLVVGYLIQSVELGEQKREISTQSAAILANMELQRRQWDPRLILRMEEGRMASLQNAGSEVARKVHVFYVDHTAKNKHIVAMSEGLWGGLYLTFELRPPYLIPGQEPGDSDTELLVVYDTQVEELRAQRFIFQKSDGGLIGWQVGPAGPVPEYFMQYSGRGYA